MFEKFGRVTVLTMKKGYTFVEFDDYHDAEDAIENLDGKVLEDDFKLVVTESTSNNSRKEFNRDRDGGSGRDSRNCFNCGEPGHFAKDCDKPQKERKDRGSNGDRKKSDIVCFNCQEVCGNIAKHCPKPPKRR